MKSLEKPSLQTSKLPNFHKDCQNEETADSADWSRLGAGSRRQDAQWKLRSLEAWKLGGAPEVEARAAALGGDETGHYAVFTKNTKTHEGTRRLPVWGKRRLFHRFARKTFGNTD